MEREKKRNYRLAILFAIIAVALICSLYLVLPFSPKTTKSNVYIYFKRNDNVSYAILINDSLIITSNKVRKLLPIGFYKQTIFDTYLNNGNYIIAIKDFQNKTLAIDTFDIANHNQKYIYLFTDKIEIKNEPYMLD
jgi:hypothetical protein